MCAETHIYIYLNVPVNADNVEKHPKKHLTVLSLEDNEVGGGTGRGGFYPYI